MNRQLKYFTGVMVGLVAKPADAEGNPCYEVSVEKPDGKIWKGVTQKSAPFAYGLGTCLGKPVQVSFTGVKTITNCIRSL